MGLDSRVNVALPFFRKLVPGSAHISAFVSYNFAVDMRTWIDIYASTF